MFYSNLWGKCKRWTADYGLDRGLNCGLDCGLGRGLVQDNIVTISNQIFSITVVTITVVLFNNYRTDYIHGKTDDHSRSRYYHPKLGCK